MNYIIDFIITKNTTMTTNEKLVGVLNDLILINNDRIEGYEKAINNVEAGDVDLKAAFNKLASQSRGYKNELAKEVARLGGEVSTGTTNSGKLYRVWMDIKDAFSINDRQSALEACEGGEDAALNAYKDALQSDAEMSADVRQVITSQQSEIKVAQDVIKKYRDLHAAVNS